MTERNYTNKSLARDYYASKKEALDNNGALKVCSKIAEKIEKCKVNIPEYYSGNKGSLSGFKDFGREMRKCLEKILSTKVSYVREDGVIVLPSVSPRKKGVEIINLPEWNGGEK